MRVAVLMSTYNGHEFLEEQLSSLAMQTIRDEMIVYIRDDGSSDNTLEIVDKWKNRINIVLYKETNAGPAMSFWKLFMKTEIQADYYAFCDQDDIWDVDKLEEAIKKLNDETCLYACNCRIIDEYGNVIEKERIKTPPIISVLRLFVTGVTQGCSMVFTNSLRQYLIQKKLQCIPMHDIVLMLYGLIYGQIYWDNIPRFSYRIHSKNVVAKGNKSIIQKIKTIFWNWRNSAQNSMADVAKEMLNTCEKLTEEEQQFLTCVAGYKTSFKKKIKILTDERLKEIDREVRRSYCVRVMLGMF